MQMSRFGDSCESRFRQNFQRKFDWVGYNSGFTSHRLHAMADYLGLNIKETMAFGDGGNDIFIIKEAGVGVAMGNAGEEVK